jgi:hypothetical protein
MKRIAIKHLAVFAALVVSSAANAGAYDYTEHYDYVGKTRLANSQQDAQLQADTATCDSAIGAQPAMPSASYRSCMLQHGWKYTSLTRTKDPNFSSNAKVAPGHFIDHENGMDCQNIGGAEVCDPPNGTVHYFDPDQNLPCTRTGAMSICSNM